jgi:uncharacterized protein DUF5995
MSKGRRKLGVLLALACLATALLGAGQARAENLILPNWPQLLPANPYTPAGTDPLPWDVCKQGQPSCPNNVIKEMIDRWQPLDASCDHRAVFALTYLRTTQEFARTITEEPGTFSDIPWITHEDAVFAQLYFNAYDDYVAGRSVPEAWRIAFDNARNPNIEGMGDLLLGMNAHINRDLPVAVVSTCTQLQTTPDSGSHHADFTHVNAVLATVEPAIRQALEDAFLLQADRDAPGLQDVVANFDMAKARETAWSNARTLWFLQQLNPADGAAFLVGLDHLAGFAGRGLLVPLLGGLTPASK